jgi:RHS repeat-associated protein
VYNTSGWCDQLLRIDVSGNVPCDNEDGYCWCTNSENFSYNNIGNPTYYRNKSLTWSKVNQLTYFDGNTFSYDASGIRMSKNGITYEYHGDMLHKETRGSTTIEYIYGIDGVIGFIYNGLTPYYYIKNLFGDVIKIANNQNVIVAEYLYDAWGNHTITYDPSGIGSINPIRYRGYYYDTETGLYYLKTRYYDPEIGRFISPDSTKYLDPESIH